MRISVDKRPIVSSPIVPKHPWQCLEKMTFVPIKSNQILLFAKYSAGARSAPEYYLHLSIHEIRTDHRVGPTLWSFNGSVDGHFNILDLELIKSTENALGITFWVQFHDHWKLFDISTTETDVSNNLPLIESGRIDFDFKFKSKSLRFNESPGLSKNFMQSCRTCSDVLQGTLSPDTRILLNADMNGNRHNETIDVHYLDPGGTSFSFVTRMSIPPLKVTSLRGPSELAFSPDGSKFAMGMASCGVSVWNIQSKVPLQTFTKDPRPGVVFQSRRLFQFTSGNFGKEILVFAEVRLMFTF